MSGLTESSSTISGNCIALLWLPTTYNDEQQQLKDYNRTTTSMSPELTVTWATSVAFGIIWPIVSIIGVVTNLVNIVVLSIMIRCCRTPAYMHILLAMSVADFLFVGVVLLYSLRFYWLEKPIKVEEEVEHVDFPSYFFWYTWGLFGDVCCTASNYCVVVVALFRFIAVYFPLRACAWCTRQRARAIVVSIFVGSVVINVPDALAVRLDPSKGKFMRLKAVYRAYKSTYYVAYPIISSLIPWIASIVLVSLLLLRLRSQKRIVRASSKQELRKQAEQRRLSVMLISVAAWSVVSTAPIVIHQFLTSAHEEEFACRLWVRHFQVAAQVTLVLNYAADFFMYAFINRAYRNYLRIIFCCRKSAVGAIRRNGQM